MSTVMHCRLLLNEIDSKPSLKLMITSCSCKSVATGKRYKIEWVGGGGVIVLLYKLIEVGNKMSYVGIIVHFVSFTFSILNQTR